jgi:hypothetical protein
MSRRSRFSERAARFSDRAARFGEGAPFDGGAVDGRDPVRQALPRLVIGLSLAAFGIVYTLSNLGLVEAGSVLRFWPALFVLFGLARIGASRSRTDVVHGGLWTLVGAALLLDRLHLLPVRVWDLWPLLLVFFGASMVMRAMGRRSPLPVASDEEDGSTVHALAVMSGVQRRTTSLAFRGGSLTAVMGGIEVDLSGARMVAERAVIDCFACWGGIEITVPAGWVVRSRVMPLMGGYTAKVQPPAPGEANGELLVTGWAVMGGIVVKQ